MRNPKSRSERLKRESSIERKILSYLKRNPEAQDTLRGIAEWWLLKQKIVETTSDVETAVASLVAKGDLVRHVGVDGRVSYRRPPRSASTRKAVPRQE